MTARDRLVVMVVCALAAVGGAWFFLIQPRRDEASKLGAQVTSEQAQLTTLRAQVAQGQAAKGAYARHYASLVRLGEAVPQDDNVPSLIYQLQGAASAAKVDFRSLVLQPTSGATTPAPVTTPGSTTAGSSASASKTVAASATQSSTALPPGAAVGPAGFPAEPFQFTFQGNFFHLADFFNRLERFVVATNNRVSVSGRLMTLNAINLGPAPQGFPQITATISATAYLVPASQGLLNGATTAGPASTAAPVSTSTSSAVPPAAAATAPVR